MRALAALVVLVMATTRAHANEPRPDPPELDQIRQLEQNLEYESALVLADKTIARGGFDARDLAQLHFEAGKLAAGLDHADAAADHFAKALALDPSLSLPAGTSPKISEPFQDVRARSRPFRANATRDPHDARRVIVELDDPLHLVVGVQALVDDAPGHRTKLATQDGPPFVVLVPADLRVEIVGLDDHGNHVFDRTPPVEVIVGSHPHHSWLGSWKLWATAAGFAGAVGGLSAWRERVAQDDWNQLRDDPTAHDYSQLRAIEDRGRAWALAANISFGVAGAAAIGAVIAVVAGRDRTEPSIAITAGPGSVGVAGRF